MRNAVKKLRGIGEKAEAETIYPKVTSLIDRLAKKSVIHKNKASNLKSKLAAHIAKL
jgi:small subunit ribosomal protein S20